MIQVKDLVFSYPRSKTNILQGLSFEIQKGEVFGFLGPSGAGKSTTQKIIIGILKNYKGSVQVMGKEIQNIRPDFYKKIGVAFETPNFYSKFTAMENLHFFGKLYSKEMENPREMLALVGLEDYENKKVAEFSKGMKMRLNLCRALLNKPDILFLDEPTSGLDPTNSKKVKDIILQKKNEGKTVILNTHNMTIAGEICDRVAFIVDGKIALIDSPRSLKVKYGNKNVKVEYRKDEALHVGNFPLEGLGNNASFQLLFQNGNVETIHTEEATLEDIFIKVTGRSLI